MALGEIMAHFLITSLEPPVTKAASEILLAAKERADRGTDRAEDLSEQSLEGVGVIAPIGSAYFGDRQRASAPCVYRKPYLS